MLPSVRVTSKSNRQVEPRSPGFVGFGREVRRTGVGWCAMAPSFSRSLLLSVALATPLFSAGCGKEVVRGADDPSVDAHALSTGLDKEDMKRALKQTLDKFRVS